MTLAEALAAIAPVYDGLPADETARRTEAMPLVYEAVQQRARRMPCGPTQTAEDIASRLFMKLLQHGPKRHLQLTEAAADRYLRRALKNMWIDDLASTEGGHAPMSDASGADIEYGDDSTPSPETRLLAEEEKERRARAEQLLYGAAIPAIANGFRDADAFVRNVCDIRDLARGAIDIPGLVAREDGDPARFRVVRDRLYQRQKRTRDRLFDRLPAWLAQSGLPADDQWLVARRAELDFALRYSRQGDR